MANTHAKKQNDEEELHKEKLHEEKQHRETSEAATAAAQKREPNHAIPAPDDGGHARSQAAHLGGHQHDHTKPAGDLRHYEQEREPPQEVSRAGKEYRRQ